MFYKKYFEDAIHDYEKKDSWTKHHEEIAKKITEKFNRGGKSEFPPLEAAKLEALCDCLPHILIWYIKNIY